jgi:hypothetical protein
LFPRPSWRRRASCWYIPPGSYGSLISGICKCFYILWETCLHALMLMGKDCRHRCDSAPSATRTCAFAKAVCLYRTAWIASQPFQDTNGHSLIAKTYLVFFQRDYEDWRSIELKDSICKDKRESDCILKHCLCSPQLRRKCMLYSALTQRILVVLFRTGFVAYFQSYVGHNCIDCSPGRYSTIYTRSFID